MYQSSINLVYVHVLGKAIALELKSCVAPAVEATAPLRDVKFNGTLDYPSVFRGPPNPTQDAAWQTLVNRDSGEQLPKSRLVELLIIEYSRSLWYPQRGISKTEPDAGWKHDKTK